MELVLLFRSNKIKNVLLLLLSLTGLSLIPPVIHGTYDFSIVKTFINQFIYLIGILAFYPFLIINKKNPLQILINIFYLQSSIQILSFLSPKVRVFLNVFRDDYAISKGQLEYGNIRGLAISNTAFFGLGVAYGIIIILMLSNWNSLKPKSNVLKIFLFLGLLFGSFSAARSSSVSILIFAFVKILWTIKNKNELKLKVGTRKLKYKHIYMYLTFPLIIILSQIMLSKLIRNEGISNSISTFKKFAFQLYYNYNNYGKLSTSSTDKLFKEMYFPLEIKTMVLGDGRYTGVDGKYYMYTDAGIMRNILYGGFLMIIVLLVYQLAMFSWERKELRVQNISIVIFLITVHFKGEVLGFLIISQMIIFYLLIKDIYREKKHGINKCYYDSL
ncbi:hypothetical protein P7H56_06915 [Vagococcus lutrae]|uniref:hypothetical protein n=1 Tax=Vagococcus lutrae TaxID=81947 RepID=UPI00289168CB|nr:hypothetical protein [Vagococcus lutrae]MDT2802004.1 hypothetical protein [Vagococcus lutrae]